MLINQPINQTFCGYLQNVHCT